jgi:hypothetical protein
MKKTDIEQGRTDRSPDNSITLMDQTMLNQGFKVKHVEMRQYVEREDELRGKYSLLTVLVETDKGTVEMKYDEGFKGPDALESAANALAKYVGIASLINRALIELQR